MMTKHIPVTLFTATQHRNMVAQLEQHRMWVLMVGPSGAYLFGVNGPITVDEATLAACAHLTHHVELAHKPAPQHLVEQLGDCALTVYYQRYEKQGLTCYTGLVDNYAQQVATFATSQGATHVHAITGGAID